MTKSLDQFWILLLSLSANALALALPLALLQVYDRILPNQATGSAVVIFVAVTITLFLGATFRFLRSAVFARLTAQADHFIWMDLARRFLRLSAGNNALSREQRQVVLAAPVKAREVMIGQTLIPLYDAPFAVIFLGLVWFLGGHVVFGPLAIVTVAGFVILVLLPSFKRDLAAYADAEGVAAAAFASQSSPSRGKGLNGGGFMLLSRARLKQASASMRVEAYTNLLLDVSQTASLLALVVILAVGAEQVLAGHLTTGGLAACTLLGSRGTIQAIGLFSAIARRQGASVAFRKLEALPKAPRNKTVQTAAEGPISLSGRLNGVSLDVQPGEVIVLDAETPRDAANMLDRLAAAIWGDDGDPGIVFDIAGTKVNADVVRSTSRHVIARARLTEGTITENISRYDSGLENEAYKLSGDIGLDALTGVLALGYRTQVGTAKSPLSPGAEKRVALVRAFTGEPGLVLLERPGVSLDNDGIERLTAILSSLPGTCTVVMTTENPKLREAAGRVIDLAAVEPKERAG